MTPLEKAISKFDTQKTFAEKVGVPESFVSQWLSGYRKVPPSRCRKIEALTNGEVTAEQLRPEIFAKYVA